MFRLPDALVANEIAVPAGKLIARVGRTNDTAYAIEDGWAIEYKYTVAGDRQVVNILVPGDLVCLDMIAFPRATGEVVALTNLRAKAFTRGALEQAYVADPSLGLALLGFARRERALLAEHLVNVGRRTAYQRIAYLILELRWRLKLADGALGLEFPFPLDQAQIGDALGLSTTHVSRTIARIERDGLIEVRYQAPRRIVIRSIDALMLAAGFDSGYLPPLD